MFTIDKTSASPAYGSQRLGVISGRDEHFKSLDSLTSQLCLLLTCFSKKTKIVFDFFGHRKSTGRNNVSKKTKKRKKHEKEKYKKKIYRFRFVE